MLKNTDYYIKSQYRDGDACSKMMRNHEKKLSNFKSSSNNEDGREQKYLEKCEATKSIYGSRILNGIDSESGVSFAEALGMCDGPEYIRLVKKKSASMSFAKYQIGKNSIKGNSADALKQNKKIARDNDRVEPLEEGRHHLASGVKEKNIRKRYHSTERADLGIKEDHISKKSKKHHIYDYECTGKSSKSETSEDEDPKKRESEKEAKVFRNMSSELKSESQSRSTERNERRKNDASDTNGVSNKSVGKRKSHLQEKGTGSKNVNNHGNYSADPKCTNSKGMIREKKHQEMNIVAKSTKGSTIANGIDSRSGVSFAEALAICDGPKPVTNSTKKKPAHFKNSDNYRNSFNAVNNNATEDSSERIMTSSSYLKSKYAQQERIPRISTLLPVIKPQSRPIMMDTRRTGSRSSGTTVKPKIAPWMGKSLSFLNNGHRK